MVKIYININIQKNRFENELILSIKKNILKDRNISIVGNVEESDLIIFLVNSVCTIINLPKQYNFIFETTKPVILLERLDSSVTWCRNLDRIKNLKAVIKNRIINPIELNNEYLYNGRYHSFLIYNEIKNRDYNLIEKRKPDLSTQYFKGLKKIPPISDKDLKKFKAILWDFHSSPVSDKMDPYRKQNINFESKNIDIFCIHSSHEQMLGWARNEVFVKLNKLKDKYKIITGKLHPDEYINSFRNSKICIACWGYGEWVHMDGYAMYSGVILIKPNSDHVKMVPDIYKPYETYIPCKPDFSDLEQVIDDALKNYDKYKEMLIKNRELVMQYNKKKCMKIFWDEVIKIYNE